MVKYLLAQPDLNRRPIKSEKSMTMSIQVLQVVLLMLCICTMDSKKNSKIILNNHYVHVQNMPNNGEQANNPDIQKQVYQLLIVGVISSKWMVVVMQSWLKIQLELLVVVGYMLNVLLKACQLYCMINNISNSSMLTIQLIKLCKLQLINASILVIISSIR